MDSARDDMAEKNAPSSFHRVLFLRLLAHRNAPVLCSLPPRPRWGPSRWRSSMLAGKCRRPSVGNAHVSAPASVGQHPSVWRELLCGKLNKVFGA
eukprot:scaffold17405_cov35-Tisochrysis_lutea.AAC.2